MDINFSYSTGHAGDVKIEFSEESNPAAVVASQTFPAPHSSRAVSQSGLDEVPHRVRLLAMPGESVLNSFWKYPKSIGLTVYDPIIFQIGDGGASTPIAGTTEYRNEVLAGKSYWVERRGFGTQRPEDTTVSVMEDNKEITKVPEGGFDLSIAGDQFNTNETWVIHIHPTAITTSTAQSIAGKWFDGAVSITTSTAYDAAHLRKLIKLRTPGITYTLPAGASFPIGYPLAFQTFGFNGAYTIACAGSDSIQYAEMSLTEFDLVQNQFLILIWDGTNWQVVTASSTAFAGFTSSDDPELDDGSVLATTAATADLADRIKILGSGEHNIGDVASGDPEATIIHNLNISGNYIVLGSFKSNGAPHSRNNTIGWCFHTALANSFKITMQELNSETQNVSFCWLAVRI